MAAIYRMAILIKQFNLNKVITKYLVIKKILLGKMPFL